MAKVVVIAAIVVGVVLFADNAPAILLLLAVNTAIGWALGVGGGT